MRGLERFDPDRHIPVTDDDRDLIGYALLAGWELMVDARGTVWVGDHEAKVAAASVSRAGGSISIRGKRRNYGE